MNPVSKSKTQRGKKEPLKFGAESIDNTAPVKKILDELQHKNNPAFVFYARVLRPRIQAAETNVYGCHCSFTGHPIYAFNSEWDGGLKSGFFEPFQYKSLLPKFLTPYKNIEAQDPVTELIALKREWRRKLMFLKLSASRHLLMDQYEELNDEVLQCPKLYVDIAAKLDSDPDEYFDDPYNWYYAGKGNLQLISIEWKDYILHSVMTTLYLSPFSKTDLRVEKEETCYDCGKDNFILETIFSTMNIVALRTKYKLFILKINTEEKITIEKLRSIESKLPFTSISFDEHHKNILYVTNIANELKTINLDRMKARTVTLKSKITSLTNNWNTVLSSHRGTYTHVTRNSVNVYDKRNNNLVQVHNNIRDYTDQRYCNEISAAKLYKDSSYMYYLTEHHLFQLDMRQESKPKMTLRWTHGMECAPTYISTCNFEYNKELISMSSQWCEDICVVPNYLTHSEQNNDIDGVTLPYRLPSILKVLAEARERLLCFDIFNPIDDRVCTAITGQFVMEHNENYVVVTQNSLGDIMHHVLYPDHMDTFMEDDAVQHLSDWSQPYKKTKKDFEISHLKDISKFWNQLEKVPTQYKFNDNGNIANLRFKIMRKEIADTFDNEKLDSGLLDVWKNTGVGDLSQDFENDDSNSST